MLTRVRLQDFKLHLDTNLELTPFHVLVGGNGSGKTSVLQAMECLSLTAAGPPVDAFQGERAPEIIVRQGASQGIIELSGFQGAVPWSAAAVLRRQVLHNGLLDPPPPPVWSLETLRWTWGKETGDDRKKWHGGPSEKEDLPDPEWGYGFQVAKAIEGMVLLKLNFAQLAAPSHPNPHHTTPRIEHDGGGLASVLSYLLSYDPDRYVTVRDAVQCVVPSVRRLRVRPSRITAQRMRRLSLDTQSVSLADKEDVMGHELVIDFDHAREVPASAASEGTLLTIGLMTLLHSKLRPRVVLIDDIEQGLHPVAQQQLVRQLRIIQKEVSDLQILATTHSPFVVSACEPEEVSVLYVTDGVAHVKRLDQHPDARHALQVLDAGEFWSSEGESWVAEKSTRQGTEQ